MPSTPETAASGNKKPTPDSRRYAARWNGFDWRQIERAVQRSPKDAIGAVARLYPLVPRKTIVSRLQRRWLIAPRAPWRTRERDAAVKAREAGVVPRVIAKETGRTPGAIRKYLWRLKRAERTTQPAATTVPKRRTRAAPAP